MYTNRISGYSAILIFAVLIIVSLAVAYLMANLGTGTAPLILMGFVAVFAFRVMDILKFMVLELVQIRLFGWPSCRDR